MTHRNYISEFSKCHRDLENKVKVTKIYLTHFPSQQCIYASLVKIHPLVKKIVHRNEATPTGSTPKTMSPSLRLGRGGDIMKSLKKCMLDYCCLLFFFFKINFLKISLQEYQLHVKQFGSRSVKEIFEKAKAADKMKKVNKQCKVTVRFSEKIGKL